MGFITKVIPLNLLDMVPSSSKDNITKRDADVQVSEIRTLAFNHETKA